MPGRRVATLQDVASAAGVSIATVSKSLSGKGRISSDTRSRVRAIATDLNYRPNPLALSLVTGRASTVGMLIRDSRIERFALPIMVGAEEALSDIDLSLIVCDAHGDAARALSLLRRLDQRKVDGIIIVGDNTSLHPSLTDVTRAPVVYAYHESDQVTDVAHLPDDRSAAYDVATHLLRSGRRRLAHVTGPCVSRAVIRRVEGVEQSVQAAGTTLAAPIYYGPWSQTRAFNLVRELLDRVPDLDAVICGSDQLGRGIVSGLQACGRRVPDDVAVTGFDNWPDFAEDGDPALTTIDMNLERLGASAARDVLRLDEQRVMGAGTHRHACRLIPRSST